MKTFSLILIFFFILQNILAAELHQLEKALLELTKELKKDKLHAHFIPPPKNLVSNNFFNLIHENHVIVTFGVKPHSRSQVVVVFNAKDFSVIKNVNKLYLMVFTVPCNLSSIFATIWERNNLLNVNAILLKEDKIQSLTYFPFSNQNCNSSKVIKVTNEFVAGKWKFRNIFPSKILNFYGCPLKLGIPLSYPATDKREYENGSVEFYGSDIRIASALAQKLNFVNQISMEDQRGDINEDGTAHALVGELARRNYDYLVGWFFLSNRKFQALDSTQPYFFVPLVVIVPPGRFLIIKVYLNSINIF